MSAFSLSNLNRKKKNELISLAESLGLSTDGTKDELVDRIRTSQIDSGDNSSLTAKKSSSKENGNPSKPKRSRSTSVQPVKTEPDEESEMSKHTEVLAGGSGIKLERGTKQEYEAENSSLPGYEEEEDIGEAATAVVYEMAGEAKQVMATLESETSDIAALVEERAQELVRWLTETLRLDHFMNRMKRVRRTLSHSRSILYGTLLFEFLVYLQTSLPRTYKVILGPTNLGGLLNDESTLTFHLPNLSLLLHTDFWYPFIAWTSILLIAPMVIGFFVNFEPRRHHYFSPLTFAVARYCLVLYASRNWEILDTLFTRISPFLLMMSSGITGLFSFFESYVRH